MSKDKKDGKLGDSHGQIVFFGALLAVAVIMRAWPRILGFLLGHETTIFFLLIFFLLALATIGIVKVWNWYAKREQEKGITAPDETSVFLGMDTDSRSTVHLKQNFRTMHAQVIGTTHAGKTESVILPWAIQDIKNGSGTLIIDGKSDADFVKKFYSYIKLYEREADFRLFSLANIGPSSSFNPLKGDSPREVTERVFSSFTFENEYYKNIQYKLFLNLVRLIFAQKEVPTFSLVQRLLTDPDELLKWVTACPEQPLKQDMTRFLKLAERDREEKTSGLETMLSHFTSSEVSELFEETDNAINFDEALKKGHIVYFQLPTMYFPFLAAATGKLVLQCFQNAVSKRQIHLGGEREKQTEVLFVHP